MYKHRLKRDESPARVRRRRSAGFATAGINFIKCKNIFSSLSKIDTHVRYNDATMDEWPGAVRARRDNVPGRGVAMRIVSSVTRILVYIVIIILGVLALAAPYALEYYEFEASTRLSFLRAAEEKRSLGISPARRCPASLSTPGVCLLR